MDGSLSDAQTTVGLNFFPELGEFKPSKLDCIIYLIAINYSFLGRKVKSVTGRVKLLNILSGQAVTHTVRGGNVIIL